MVDQAEGSCRGPGQRFREVEKLDTGAPTSSAAPPFPKKQDTSERLDFLYWGSQFLEKLLVEALFKAATMVQGHKQALRDGLSIVRACGQVTTTSALWDGKLRSRAISHSRRRRGPATLINFADRHPTQFQCRLEEGEARYFRLEGAVA
ncbi:MAG: hypothetical protein Q9166_001946 [cf. Caloplaca sp. 2 TL-2023]